MIDTWMRTTSDGTKAWYRNIVAIVVAVVVIATACGSNDTVVTDSAGRAAESPTQSVIADDPVDEPDEVESATGLADASETNSEIVSDADDGPTAGNETDDEQDRANAARSVTPEVGVNYDPGSAQTDLLGTSASFTIDVPWSVIVTGVGSFVLAEPGATDPFGASMALFRAAGFATDDELVTQPPPDRFGGNLDQWLADASDYLLADPVETEVGGQPAIVFDLVFPDDAPAFGEDCGPPPQNRCIFMGSSYDNEMLRHLVHRSGRNTRVWVVDQGDFEPIVISGSAPIDEPNWHTDVWPSLVDSLEFGEPQPAPAASPQVATVSVEPGSIENLDAGPASFTAAGGISFDLPQPVTAISSFNCAIIVEADYSGESPFAPGFAIATSAFLGRNELTPFSTVEEWFAGYEGQPEPVATNETITLLGYKLDGYRIDGAFADAPSSDDATLNCAVDSDTISDLQVFAAVFSDLYVAETDDGLLVAVANGFTEEEQLRGRALLDAVLPTVQRG